MATFPSDGILLFPGYAENPESVVERTPMDDGMAKQSRIYSSREVQRTVRYKFTRIGYIDFKTWVDTDIAGGSGFFDWVDPLDGLTKQGRMVNGGFSGVPDSTGEGQEPDWIVSFTLETIE